METKKVITAFCLVVVLLVGTAAMIGVFFRGDMSAVEVVSVRGEHYEMIVDGIYQYNAKRLVAEGVGWDIFTLKTYGPLSLENFQKPGKVHPLQHFWASENKAGDRLLEQYPPTRRVFSKFDIAFKLGKDFKECKGL